MLYSIPKTNLLKLNIPITVNSDGHRQLLGFFATFFFANSRKKVVHSKNNKWDNEYPTKISATCPTKKREGLYRFKAKRPFRPSGGSVFLPPDFSGQVMGTVRLTVPC